MKKTSEKRKMLFRSEKPHVRELKMPDDLGILWAAYKTNSFELESGLTQTEFADTIDKLLFNYNIGWMVEDRTSKLSNGRGAVALILGNSNSYEVEPEFFFFSWATTRAKLRVAVQFLNMMRYSRDFGVVTVNGLDEDKKFLNRIERFGVLTYLATMPKGTANGNRHIYYTHGRA